MLCHLKKQKFIFSVTLSVWNLLSHSSFGIAFLFILTITTQLVLNDFRHSQAWRIIIFIRPQVNCHWCVCVQKLSDLCTELTEPEAGMAISWLHEKYILRICFCTVPISINIVHLVYIFLLLPLTALHYSHLHGKDVACRICEFMYMAIGLIHNFLYNILNKKLFKDMKSVSWTVSTILTCT